MLGLCDELDDEDDETVAFACELEAACVDRGWRVVWIATATGPSAVALPPTAEARESVDPPAVCGEESQLRVSSVGEIAMAPRGLRLITFGWYRKAQYRGFRVTGNANLFPDTTASVGGSAVHLANSQ